jgi:putative tryptophan/tyrosine transport system substrate-binding protein
MRRRDLLILSGAAAVARPLKADAQTTTVPAVGFLHPASREPFARLVTAFHEGLNETGFVEGQNVKIEYRWAEGREDRLKTLATNLVDRRVAVIAATGGSFVALAAKAATATVPIVFLVGSDPVQLGLVSSLNRPGGNATGVSLESTEMLAKRLEVLRDLFPGGANIAMLKSSASTVEKSETELVERHGLIVLQPRAAQEFEEREFADQFAAAIQSGANALLVSADPFFMNRRNLIVALAAKHALPAVYPWREYALAGGLASYGPSIIEAYREIGRYVGRILKGAKPQDLPVQLPTKFELVINLKTAKALGLAVPTIMFARANELIE